MSESETTVTYEPVWLKHRANVVEAIPYDGTEHCRRWICEWVLGHTVATHDGFVAHARADGALMLFTPQGWHVVQPGQWVIRGTTNEHYNPDDEVVTLNYDRVPGPDRGATLTRDQAAAIVVAADAIKDEVRAWPELGAREHVDTLVESVHQLATALEALR